MDTESNPCSMSTPLVKLLIEECLIDIINKKFRGIARGISEIAKWTYILLWSSSYLPLILLSAHTLKYHLKRLFNSFVVI